MIPSADLAALRYSGVSDNEYAIVVTAKLRPVRFALDCWSIGKARMIAEQYRESEPVIYRRQRGGWERVK